MILLFNLNKYIGGGEVLLIRFAKYLHTIDAEYSIISFGTSCYIADEAKKNKLNLIEWPVIEDSVLYMNNRVKDELINSLKLTLSEFKNIKIFTFCFRDLYNSLFIFSRIRLGEVSLTAGIYHPEDVHYLTSFSLSKTKILEFNRAIIKLYGRKNAIIFMNENCRAKSYGIKENNYGSIIPIPISKSENITINKSINTDKVVNIVCISRFVEFKIGSILAIVKIARKNKKYHLDIIGYGWWKFVLDMYIFIFNMKNINIYTNIKPDDLGLIIKKSEIGYAQGTSILEISKYGLPVIIAPYSKLKDIFVSGFRCMGVFGQKDDLNFGDTTSNTEFDLYSIESCINNIVDDYQYYCSLSKQHTKKFLSEIIYDQMIEVIYASKFNNKNLDFKLIKPPILKRIKYYISNNKLRLESKK